MSEKDMDVIIQKIVDTSIKIRIPTVEDIRIHKLDIPVRSYAPVSNDKIYNREVNSIATDLVVNDFINSTEKTYNFMNIICLLFNKSIDYYCQIKNLKRSADTTPGDIFFMYKGGNVLRLIYYEFSKNIGVGPNRILDQFFSKSFKKSDSDFSIVINPELENYDKIFEDMISLSYVLQTIIRKQFNREPKGDMFDVFAFTEYNDQKKSLILSNMLRALNSSESTKDKENPDFYGAIFTKIVVMGYEFSDQEHDSSKDYKLSDKYGDKNTVAQDTRDSRRSDFAIDTCDNTDTGGFQQKDACIYPLISPKDGDHFYISANRSLDFRTGLNNSIRVKFTLVRTKLNCVAYMTKNNENLKKLLGAEVIDCSMTHRKATGYSSKEEMEKFKTGISFYSLSMADKHRLDFFGYNIPGMIHDLEFMMFEQNEVPWLDAKFAKRFNRLFFMYMVDLYIDVIDNTERINIINKFRESMQIINKISFEENRNKYIDSIKNIIPLDNRIHLNKSMTEFIRIASISFDAKKELQNMINIIDENTKHMLDVLGETQKYINSDGTYNKQLYEGSVSSMAGGFSLSSFPEYIKNVIFGPNPKIHLSKENTPNISHNKEDNSTNINIESFDLSHVTTDADKELSNLRDLFDNL
jgi:hypothetical protein